MKTTTAHRLSPARSTQAANAVLQVAERLHAMEPDWVVFFSEMLGIDGHVQKMFPHKASLQTFECSPQYARISELLDDLRSRQAEAPKRQSRRVVTVRMPRSLHETLKTEARRLGVSINQLCVTKLIRMLDEHDLENFGFEVGEPDESDDERGGADL